MAAEGYGQRRLTDLQPMTRSAPHGVLILIALVALMWALEVVDVALDHRLDRYGIEPRDVDGLDGVVAAPFLHVGFGHLIAQHASRSW